MSINVNDYSDVPLPGCLPALIDSENYLDFRNHLVDLLAAIITPAAAVTMYDIIVEGSPSHLIDAREYVLNELQYEIRRARAAVSDVMPGENEAEILQDWAISLSERTDARFWERGDTDDVLDLINEIKERRTIRKEKTDLQ